MKKERVTQDQFKKICERLIDGESLTRICKSDEFPHYRTVLRHINDSEKAHEDYRRARAFQAEVLRDEIVDIVIQPLPTDPKLAMAEVQRRRLEVEQKDKYVRQLAPLGLRNRPEDQGDKKFNGTITLKWDESPA